MKTIKTHILRLLAPISLAVFYLATPLLASDPVPVGIPGAWTMTFHDEFDGATVDMTKWCAAGWHNATATGDGWPTNDQQIGLIRSSNATVSGGTLKLTARAESVTSSGRFFPYTTAMLHSWGIPGQPTPAQFKQSYGVFEARIYLPAVSATDSRVAGWPAFWMNTDDYPWPTNEIDVAEFHSIPGSHLHSAGRPDDWMDPLKNFDVPGVWSNSWHTYSVLWTPTQLDFYYDGVKKGTITKEVSGVPDAVILVYDIGNRTDTPLPTVFPSTMQVDYIRVWQGTAGTSAPTITTQPANKTVTVGQTATFSVVATGNPVPAFQWQKNSVNIAGATSTSYTTPATVIGDNGSTFRCVVTNSAGSVTSNNAILTVNPSGGGATLTHQYTFNAGNFNDSVGTANGTLNGSASISGGALQLSGGSNGTAYGSLPTSVMSGLTSASFEGWFTESAVANWEKVFFPGNTDTSSFLGLTSSQGTDGHSRVDFLATGSSQQAVAGPLVSTGTKYYFACVYDGVGNIQSLYIAPAGGSLGSPVTTSLGGKNVSNINFVEFWLGRSPFGGDQDFAGSIDEFRIYNGALTASQIAANYAAGPTSGGGSAPSITSALTTSGTVGTAFSYQITASNSPTSYNATGLPGGLSVNTSSGLISGTPSVAGTSNVTISATNANGTGTATLVLTVNPSGGGGGGASIGIQFVGGQTALNATDSAGLSTVAQTHWNALAGASFSNVALTDNSGSATSTKLTGTANGTYRGGGSSASPAGNAKLASGELFNGWPGAPTLTVSGIPYAKYDIYVYAGIDATGRNETVSLTPSGGSAQYFSFLTQGGGSAWTVATSTWNGTGTPPTLPSANYVNYTGLTAGSFTMAWGAPGNGGLNGIQIVNTSSGGLPSPWINQDIGSVGVTGSSSYSGGVFTVNGSGADIWGSADGFQYVSQTVSGTTHTISARVTQPGTSGGTQPGYGKAGIMFRDTTGAGSEDAYLVYTNGIGLQFLYRSSTGGGASQNGSNVSASFPVWVKLVKSNNSFTAYYGTDGVNWTQIGAAQTVSFTSGNYLTGMVSCSHDNSKTATSKLDNLNVQ
ncbi:MAG: family 16 glycosylhydrolase [Methylacidiphilales bacterium]|nr:family 16 glycosylhydrolase [Candidatus Methylacidiphilales bacterium]